MADSAKWMVRYGSLTGLGDLLDRHPRLLKPQAGSLCALEFGLNSYRRSVVVGYRPGCPAGVIELFDNNPIVCAETVCVPSPAATLALLAIDPLCKAGLAEGTIHVSCSSEGSVDDIEPFLAALGDRVSVKLSSPITAVEGRLAVEVRLPRSMPEDELEDLYDETFGRSMLVMREPAQHPLAASYKAHTVEGGVAIRFESSEQGKAGAAQAVQVLNVMAGFEDSLGLS